MVRCSIFLFFASAFGRFLTTFVMPRNTLPLQENAPPPETTQTTTCEICIEPMELHAQKSRFLKDCDHPFCSECMIKYICAKLDDNINKILCPAVNCNKFLDPFKCQTLVPPDVFVRWCDLLCESTIMGLERSYCPNRNCSALIINECGRRRRRNKKANCPNCKLPFCFECKIPWHGVLGCEESQEFRGDIEFGILAKKKMWKRCPRCRHFVERVNGCLIIKCRCHARFCYNCGAEVTAHMCKCQEQGSGGLICFCICLILFLAYTCALIVLPFIANTK